MVSTVTVVLINITKHFIKVFKTLNYITIETSSHGQFSHKIIAKLCVRRKARSSITVFLSFQLKDEGLGQILKMAEPQSGQSRFRIFRFSLIFSDLLLKQA